MANRNVPGFTCGDILLIPDFREAAVLAGANGLDRPVTRVNVMEVPDVIDWVRPGEFLITTGFPFRDNADVLADLIPQLNDRGVSALGIKIKRFIDRIPQRALDIAERLDFPVFELPASTVFSDAVRSIMERVLVQEAKELSLLQSRFRTLSQQLLHGKGIGGFLETLEEMLDNPVLLLDEGDHAYFSPQASCLGLPDSPADWRRIRDEIRPGIFFATVAGRRARAYAAEISNKDMCAYLVVPEWNREHSVVDQLTIDRAGLLVGMEMINAYARREVEAKYVDQFLQDWLSGRIATREDLAIRAEACGCPLREGHVYYAGVIRWIDGRPALHRLRQTAKRTRLRIAEAHVHTTVLEGELALLFSLPPAFPVKRAADEVIAQMRAGLPDNGAFSVCLGNRAERADQVHVSYRQARKVHAISRVCGVREPLVDAARLGVYQLLYLLPDSEEVRHFRDRFIVPLAEYDRKHGTMLLETLKVYFRHNRSAKKTSAELFTHYNTVNYRVERALELLGIDAESGDDMLQLELAIKLRDMWPQEGETGHSP
ncbi:MAG: PucR family transcriptional regulator [Paenibacillaceae bacterium ZCTH02-B3]|nr:MAG: PucR family transcriptional regulator [Paenibacillaceae bacterium ZCTH02-B3]